jgi:dolichyl-diphosphooligosaccharide--protein glycosyltransferase
LAVVKKPGRRKQSGHGRTYLVLGIVLVLIAVSTSYAYVTGLGPFKPQSSTSTTTSSTRSTSLSSATSTATASLLYAKFNTSLGSFEVELFNSLTPKTVANFVNLVNQGFYNSLVWHRIEPGFVIQTGDPTTKNGGGNRANWGSSSSDIYVQFEYVPSLHNDEYYLGMASTGAGVGGSSQFYINLANNSALLDGKYAVFGKVISGMSVVQALGSVPVEQVGGPQGQHEPVTPVYVTSVTMVSGP